MGIGAGSGGCSGAGQSQGRPSWCHANQPPRYLNELWLRPLARSRAGLGAASRGALRPLPRGGAVAQGGAAPGAASPASLPASLPSRRFPPQRLRPAWSCSLADTFESPPAVRQAALSVTGTARCSALITRIWARAVPGQSPEIWSCLVRGIEVQESREAKGCLYALFLGESEAHGLSWVRFRSKAQVTIRPPALHFCLRGKKTLHSLI